MASLRYLVAGVMLFLVACRRGGQRLRAGDRPARAPVSDRPGLIAGDDLLLAMTCYVIALRGLPTATVSTYAYVNPVVAVALG
jgi:drug/metabolite transporter (DMT)-like permease